ncbi:MAG: metalloregulator ArsR/SmtB family transcription factor [Nitrospira sp.]|nr:metalloregulator ArsR/SmtB family transcription factor [Nitrospira sp.]MDR4474945.1 metalloregulator ArsR/SmtB family transcription factor [Nitrospira sp.]
MKCASIDDILTAGQCATVLKALADETRLRLLESLLVEEQCVTELARELRCPQPHISHHLRILRDAGLVEGLRDGKQVCYRIDPTVKRALANRQGQALNFGCCEVRFPETVLTMVTHAR